MPLEELVERTGAALFTRQGAAGAQEGARLSRLPRRVFQQRLQCLSQVMQIVHRARPLPGGPGHILGDMSLITPTIGRSCPPAQYPKGGFFGPARLPDRMTSCATREQGS